MSKLTQQQLPGMRETHESTDRDPLTSFQKRESDSWMGENMRLSGGLA
jgi:hypothetical protein